jgi:hypothetical protein
MHVKVEPVFSIQKELPCGKLKQEASQTPHITCLAYRNLFLNISASVRLSIMVPTTA